METYLGESEASFCNMHIIISFACKGASRLSREAAQLQGCEDNCKMPIIWGSRSFPPGGPESFHPGGSHFIILRLE